MNYKVVSARDETVLEQALTDFHQKVIEAHGSVHSVLFSTAMNSVGIHYSALVRYVGKVVE